KKNLKALSLCRYGKIRKKFLKHLFRKNLLRKSLNLSPRKPDSRKRSNPIQKQKSPLRNLGNIKNLLLLRERTPAKKRLPLQNQTVGQHLLPLKHRPRLPVPNPPNRIPAKVYGIPLWMNLPDRRKCPGNPGKGRPMPLTPNPFT